MNLRNLANGLSGQALVEAIVLIPALLFVSFALVSILSYSSLPIWMEEILTLQLSDKNPGKLLEAVGRSRQTSSLPPYFNKDEVDVQRSVFKSRVLPLPLHMANPINRLDISGHFLWSKTMERTPFSILKVFKGYESATAKMSFTAQKNLSEKDASIRVRKVFMSGLTMGRIMNQLEMSGISLFHLNFNALPDSASSGKKNESKK